MVLKRYVIPRQKKSAVEARFERQVRVHMRKVKMVQPRRYIPIAVV